MHAEEDSSEENVNGENALVYSAEHLKKCVHNLYNFRDNYFDNHSIDDVSKKRADIDNELQSTLAILDKFQDTALKQDKAIYYYLRGKALNIHPEYDKTAQEWLSKAVKLDPKLVDAWNELGECYWKNNNIKEAKTCFMGALSHQRNKVSLRNLSMLFRQDGATSKDEQIENIRKGLEYAKEAVQLDPLDGNSWTVLGNAHLSEYFLISQNPKTLKLCISAYKQAEKDVSAKNNIDLYYNKGIALKYEEEYLAALESFGTAKKLDPTWDFPKIKTERLLKYLEDVTELVSTNGRMKTRRLQQLIQTITEKHLGPYANGKITLRNGETISLEQTKIALLNQGENRGKIIIGKVVCSVQNEDTVPFTFCIVDKDSTCAAVTIYNLAEGKGVIIGDSVAIPEPFYTEVQITYNDKKYHFKKIRVENPLILIVNGKQVNRNQQAETRMTTFTKS